MLGCLRFLQSPHRIPKNKTNEKQSRCQTMHQPSFPHSLGYTSMLSFFLSIWSGHSRILLQTLYCGYSPISWTSVSFPKVPDEKALCKLYLSYSLFRKKSLQYAVIGVLEVPAFISVWLCLPQGHAACFDSGSPQIVGISRACLDKLEIKAFSRQTARCSY